MADKLNEFRVSNDALDDAPELRRRIGGEGYLFFKRLQEPATLRRLRLEMLEVIRDGGWIQAGTHLMDARADVSQKCTEGDLEYTRVYHEVYKLESFHSAGHWPVVLETMEKIIGAQVLPHPVKIARLWFPQFTDHTTPAHQDFVHFQGSFDTFTCWTPVGDCPIELGGLAILPGSHKANAVFDHHFSLGAGSLTVNADEHSGDWLTTNYEIGDSLIFHSLTVHKALPNLTADRLRVSLDNRYQALGLPIAEQMFVPHLSSPLSPLSWDEIYAGWESKDFQYYWKDLDLTVVPRDPGYSEKAFSEAVELAGKGDPRARLHLQRAARRDPDSDVGKEAARVLSELDVESPGGPR